MIRILHLADVHLAASYSSFGDVAEDRRRAVVDAFERLPDVVAEHDVHAVLIAGDLFDGPQPSDKVIASARETLRRILDAGLPVFVVPGNHDALTLTASPYHRLPEKIHVFDTPSFEAPASVETEGGPLHVYGIAHDPARNTDPLPTFRRFDLDGTHVVLLHGSIRDAPHWVASPNALRIEPDALTVLDVDYIALGDYHRPRLPDEFASAPACYAGSFAAVDLTEPGPRGFMIAEVGPGIAPFVELHPSGVPLLQDVGDVDVAGYSGEEEVADAVAERVADGAIPVARLVGTPSFPLDADAVQTHLRARFGWAALRDETEYYASERLDELAERDTVVGHVVRLGRTRIEDAEPSTREIHERALRIAMKAMGVEG